MSGQLCDNTILYLDPSILSLWYATTAYDLRHLAFGPTACEIDLSIRQSGYINLGGCDPERENLP